MSVAASSGSGWSCLGCERVPIDSGLAAGELASTVELQWVSAENYAGDPGAAVAAALRIIPASLPTTERRARYWTDTARAYANRGRRDKCVFVLLAAAAPTATRAGAALRPNPKLFSRAAGVAGQPICCRLGRRRTRTCPTPVPGSR
jgi:hypothetical protein